MTEAGLANETHANEFFDPLVLSASNQQNPLGNKDFLRFCDIYKGVAEA